MKSVSPGTRQVGRRPRSFSGVGWKAAPLPDLSGRTVVVTGGNSGIGFHTAKALAAQGAAVVIACRNLDLGTAAAARMAGDVRAAHLNLASMTSVRQFGEVWTGPLHL